MSETRPTTRPNRRSSAEAAPASHAEPAAAAGTPTGPTPVPPQRVAAYAAGSGIPTIAFKATADAGLAYDLDEDGNAWATTADGRLRIEFGPETSRYGGNPRGGLWLITYTDPDQPAQGWRSMFGDQVPVEAVAAFIKALLIPEGLDPDRADRDPFETQITIQITTAQQAHAEAEEQAGPADQPIPAQATAAK